MSCTAHLCISNFCLASNKSWIDPDIISLFQEDDIKRFERKLRDRNIHAWGVNTSDEIEIAIVYSNKVKNIKDRLDVLGITMSKVLDVFNQSKKEEIEKLQYIDEIDITNEYENYQLETLSLLKSASLDNFIEAFNLIVKNEYHLYEATIPEEIPPLVKYMLSENSCEFSKFPGSHDFRVLLRAVIENMDSDLLVQYDITDVVNGNYPHLIDTSSNNLVSIYNQILSKHHADSYALGSKIIILTEGTSDITILKKSLEILYPHLLDLYSFMDFSISNASGGASSLVSSIKSFISAGVQNKIIAIFDNDTAAHVARRGLSNTTIPSNIKIINYPEISLAKTYPTLGPSSGIIHMDINGLACSIELYLGSDILLDENGQLTPIQWKGFETSLNKYQGEILNKSALLVKFLNKTKECLESPSKIKASEWREMDLLLNTIFQAFNS